MQTKIDKKGLKDFCKINNVLALYIFGSQLTGNNDKFSDLDLAILFYPDFKDKIYEIDFNIKFNDKIRNFFGFKNIDIIFLQKAGLKIKFKIITEGEVIYSADDKTRLDYEDIIICRGLDFKGELSLYYRELETKVLRER